MRVDRSLDTDGSTLFLDCFQHLGTSPVVPKQVSTTDSLSLRDKLGSCQTFHTRASSHFAMLVTTQHNLLRMPVACYRQSDVWLPLQEIARGRDVTSW